MCDSQEGFLVRVSSGHLAAFTSANGPWQRIHPALKKRSEGLETAVVWIVTVGGEQVFITFAQRFPGSGIHQTLSHLEISPKP